MTEQNAMAAPMENQRMKLSIPNYIPKRSIRKAQND